MTADLVVDALQMARWRRLGVRGAIMHSDHGSQFTFWAFTSRVHEAGLLASMGTIGDCYDNAMMESFWSGMQLELLDTRPWHSRDQLATAMFSWIEGWCNPRRRPSGLGYHSSAEYEKFNPSEAELAAWYTTPTRPGNRGRIRATHRGTPVILIADDHTVTVIHLNTGEIIATNTINPSTTYWRNNEKEPGRWPGSFS